jgi:fructose-bisphosphate aldolase, class II
LKMINEYGGEIPETYGVPLSEIQEGIRHGVRKVNIDTDLRLAATAAIRKHLFTNKSEFDPRKYLGDSVKAMKKVVIERYEAFGTAGQASKIKPISLESMFSAYAKGSLDPLVN